MTTTPVVDPAQLALGLAALKQNRAEAEALIATASSWTPEIGTAVGAVLIERLKEHDALKAERDRVCNPAWKAYKTVSNNYAEHLKESEALCLALKAAVGAFELAQHTQKIDALDRAQAAVLSGDAQALGASLALVNATPARAQGVQPKLVWKVTRFVEPVPCSHCGSTRGMVPRPYWLETADTDELARFAKAHTSTDPNDPPIVPGVVFELAAEITGRRK